MSSSDVFSGSASCIKSILLFVFSSRHFAAPPSARPDEIHYQNHFFTTIKDGSPKVPTGAGFDPFSSFRTDEDSEEKPDVRFFIYDDKNNLSRHSSMVCTAACYR